MPSQTKPVDDSIGKVNNEIAVGSDLDFQRRWWRFERAIWIAFGILLFADLFGFFGRGYWAKGYTQTSDGTLEVRYERVERSATPSILRIDFGPSAIRDGKVQLWTSEGLVKQLGAQRVIPQPLSSVIGHGGFLYTFVATMPPASVAFALEPPGPGVHHLFLRVPGFEQVKLTILVVP